MPPTSTCPRFGAGRTVSTRMITRTALLASPRKHNRVNVQTHTTSSTHRRYHDDSYGFRKPKQFVLPDYTPSQLLNRTLNAPLLRYADSMRTHGHRAARIDPLDLLQREEVAALDPGRYGLVDGGWGTKYDVDGVVWVRGNEGEVGVGAKEGWMETEEWTLERIVNHLRAVYVGNIAYEFMHSPSKTERLWFMRELESRGPGVQQRMQHHDEHGDDTSRLGGRAHARKKRIHALLAQSEVFDRFLQLKFPNLKRYGLEGGESMLPAVDTLFGAASAAGISHIVLAMPHRGRLNLLTDLLRYPPSALFRKIRGEPELRELEILGLGGDVISHLVAEPTLRYPASKEYGETKTNDLHVTLLPNPSHLEAIDPVALGYARGLQFVLLKQLLARAGVNADIASPSPSPLTSAAASHSHSDADISCALGDKVLCVQMHGDASFTGQGVVMESLGLSNLPHYTSGGSMHLVLNNNIGYTTPASSARSSLYCSDIGKMIHAPVLHVNGDYPEDVARAIEVAFKYRNAFRKDVIVDLLVYRRWGHNELDEPAFTQPLMYRNIRTRKSVPEMYEERLVDEGVMTREEADDVRTKHRAFLDAELESSSPSSSDSNAPASTQSDAMCKPLSGTWKGMVWPTNTNPNARSSSDSKYVHTMNPETGVDLDTLRKVGAASVKVPDGFDIHPRLKRHVSARLKSLGLTESGDIAANDSLASKKGGAAGGIDWATAEALAWGSLMLDGYDVRISGQDVGRGTFSQRHAMLVDQSTERIVVPLNGNLEKGCKGRIELANSSLSEMAVLGFEYGMSSVTPTLLPIWEAQFGDFFNGAQVIFDTFITSAETKWLRQSGITVLLPHGLDGAGPEHSSSRIERMLQLTNDFDTFTSAQESTARINMHVAYPTTPAQYFHLLRRQMLRNYRRPLVVAGPKGLLRLPAAASPLTHLEPGTKFIQVIDDPTNADSTSAIRIVLHTGKIHYDLLKTRAEYDLASKVALIRIEELAPFPYEALYDTLKPYAGPNRTAPEVYWLQEEPRNQGAWTHVAPRIRQVLQRLGWKSELEYRGRKEDAIAATGIGNVYKKEQANALVSAFGG